MRIACRTVPYAQLPFERALQGISEAGFKWVSFGNPDHQGVKVPDENDPQSVATVRRLLDRYGLGVVMITGTTEFAVGLPLERARLRLETAKALGVTDVMSNGMPDTGKFAGQYAEFVDKYKRIAELAGSMGITISFKPHGGITATAKRVRKLMDDIGSPFVRASFDPGNVHFYTGEDPLDGFELIADRLNSFVAKDHQGPKDNRNFPLPGDGDVDFVALFRVMREQGFDGSVMIERVDGDHQGPLGAEEIDARVAAAKVKLERLLGKAGF